MKQIAIVVIAALTLNLVTGNTLAQDLPDTYWNQQQVNEILDKVVQSDRLVIDQTAYLSCHFVISFSSLF